MSYPQRPQPDVPSIECAVLDFWAADDTFAAALARPATAEFVAYDGPPFTSGSPHYGHLLTGFVKDAVPRYQTMRGRRVQRRLGWDCHGLPVEIATERALGLATKRDIAQLGVAKFNAVCAESVEQFIAEFEGYVHRQGRWADAADRYRTLDRDYTESVLWAFKTLYDKGLIYSDFRVLAYCWRCETPLSNSETRQDDAYRDRVDPAVTVSFPLSTGEELLVWTTTPWTLPANLAVAVAPEVDYAVVERDGRRLVLAEDRLAAYADALGPVRRVGTRRGADLVGARYRPPLEHLAGTAGAFRVLAADFVTTTEGTGVVHLAPAHGEDDHAACAAAGIDTVLLVDEAGRYTDAVPQWAGRPVLECNEAVIAELAARGRLVERSDYTHSYPHCWRCDTPLIYRALTGWFVAVSAFRDRLVELAEQIDWVPGHVKDGAFGQWLRGARDWSISRNRFWGAPVPVWVSDDPAHPRVDVYGSLDELERDFGVRPTDLHRPAIDALTRPNPDDPTGTARMRRVPDVLDCWFESGAMPFAQVHYPFEGADWFDRHYPADVVVEYIGQTKAWFYVLHVLGVALFDRPAFRTALTHGVVLGDDGRKASKSRRNFPDPAAMFDRHGADAVRWALLSSPLVRGGEGAVTEDAIREAARHAIRPLWNSWSFFALYASAAGHRGRIRTDSPDVLDRYALAALHELVTTVGAELDRYDLLAACAAVREFLDTLQNWYIRRSRPRFWRGEPAALDTLFTVLETLCRVLAPLLPMVAEAVWRDLTGGRSLHLTDWPDTGALPADPQLVAATDTARAVCSTALAVRKAHELRVRQPVAAVTAAGPAAAGLADLRELIAAELNAKRVWLTAEPAAAQRRLSIVPRALGPRLGPAVQRVIAAARAGDWTERDGLPVVGGVLLQPGEFRLEAARDDPATATVPGRGLTVTVDTALSAALLAEGRARDLVRTVQQARKDAGLAVTDRIVLRVAAAAQTVAAAEAHRELLMTETLAVRLELHPADSTRVSVAAVGPGEGSA